jgi:predicted SnoaL-like aldol condensation-catalyzing enzyme
VGAEARAEAHDVLVRYCEAIDDHDTEALKAVLADDVLLTTGEHRWIGKENVVDFLTSLFSSRKWARHAISNVLVEQNEKGDLVVKAYFQFVIASDVHTLGLGDYVAVMRSQDDRLLLTSLNVQILESFIVEPKPEPRA